MERPEGLLDWTIRDVENWLAKSQETWSKLNAGKFMTGDEFYAWRNEVESEWAVARVTMDMVLHQLVRARKLLEEKDAEIASIHAELMRCGLYLTNGELRYGYSDGKVDIVDINNAALYAEDRDTIDSEEK